MNRLASPFFIDSVQISNRLVLAPLAGITDLVFRGICKQMGAGLVFTEMISDQGLIYANRESFGIMEISDAERPVGVQIFGSKPEPMAKAAAIVARETPELVDINMGCPVPKVVKNGEGAALMKDPDKAMQIIRAVKSASGLPVTVKIRKGWDEHTACAVEFAIACEEAGASAVSVHGRTRSQFYSGDADWGVIRSVKRALKIPVIGNGDVWKPHDAFKMVEETGCDAVMIGRGCLGNPWLFSRTLESTGSLEAPSPSLDERIGVAVRHLDEVVKKRGERLGVPYMRKHLGWYVKGLAEAARLRRSINAAGTLCEVKAILNAIADQPRTV